MEVSQPRGFHSQEGAIYTDYNMNGICWSWAKLWPTRVHGRRVCVCVCVVHRGWVEWSQSNHREAHLSAYCRKFTCGSRHEVWT